MATTQEDPQPPWRKKHRRYLLTIFAIVSLLNNCQGVESLSASARGNYRKTTSSIRHSSDYKFWEEPISIQSFNMDLHNLAMEDPQKAQDALEIMEHLYMHRSNDTAVIRPDAASYATVMEGWSYGGIIEEKNWRTHAAVQVQALLDRMEEAKHLQPNELCYLMACQQWADAVEGDRGQNVQCAQMILDRLLRQPAEVTSGTQRRRTIPISAKLYTIVMEGWCRRVGKVPHAMEKVEMLLKDMEDGSNNMLPRPSVLTYTSVIGGLARSRKRDLASRAMQLLPKMKAHGIDPDVVAYTSILNCWAKTTSREERQVAHTHAIQILQEMEDLYTSQQDQYHVKPTAITYATAIKAIGNSLADDAPVLAEQVLHRMYRWTELGCIHVPPTVEVYNALIMSLSVTGNTRNNSTWSRSTRAHKAEQWLQEMYRRTSQGEIGVEPNIRTWGAVLKAWAESGRADAGEQAQRLLDQMEEWYNNDKSSVAPNVVCYTTVMNAWARGTSTPAKVALRHVEKLLKHMEDLYKATGDPTIRPNKISYISAMDAWSRKAKSKAHAATQAQAIVDRMMKLYALDQGYDRPTRIVFNALINAYSKSDDPGAAAQAEIIFRWMEEQYQAGDEYVKPDEITLCGVLNAWANHASEGGARRAQEILDHTESLTFEERGFGHSIVCFNILIKAWGRSREPDSVQRVETILKHLEQECSYNDEAIRPDVTTYSSVINCCAYYSGDEAGRKEALHVALQTFDKIRNQTWCLEGPNNISFGTMFKAIAKLMPISRERDTLVESLFRECVDLGQIDSFVLSQVKAASTTAMYQRMVLEPANLNIEDGNNYDKILKSIPRQWGSNIE